MREIIYLQAGNVSNYIGTHFFNTCESYFTYGDGEDVAAGQIDHDVSFREGVAPDGQPTFCPRLVVFDEKENFGALPTINELYDPGTGDAEAKAWEGSIEMNKQNPIEKSAYQRSLDESEDDIEGLRGESHPEKHGRQRELLQSIRYWSDFNRVFYLPRSLRPLSSISAAGDSANHVVYWGEGISTFERECVDADIMDGDFRKFVEECDLLQGIQTTFDLSKFGSFTTSMIQSIREYLPKTTMLSFMVNCEQAGNQIDFHDHNACRAIANASLAMTALEEHSDVNVPLLHPLVWPRGNWTRGLNFDPKSIYHTTALLSSHMESATLPLRMRSPDVRLDLQYLSRHLDTKFAHLTGAVPIPPSNILARSNSSILQDLSVSINNTSQATKNRSHSVGPGLLAEWAVIRGISSSHRSTMEDWIREVLQLREPFAKITWTDVRYPLPSSFPPIFGTSSQSTESRPPPLNIGHQHLDSVPIYSAFRSSTALSAYFDQHYKFIDTLIRRGIDLRFLNPSGMVGDDGIGKDELREVKETMLKLRDGVSTEDISESGDGLYDEVGYDIY